MTQFGTWLVPGVVAGILLAGICRGVRVFDVFVEGAREGIQTTFDVLPALIGLVCAVGMLRASGALEVFCILLAPLGNLLGLPRELLPLTVLRPVSGSGALAFFSDLLTVHGPDSLIGRMASVMQGSTETTFYTIAVYYGAAKIRNTRHTVPAALSADLAGFFCSAFLVRLFFR